MESNCSITWPSLTKSVKKICEYKNERNMVTVSTVTKLYAKCSEKVGDLRTFKDLKKIVYEGELKSGRKKSILNIIIFVNQVYVVASLTIEMQKYPLRELG